MVAIWQISHDVEGKVSVKTLKLPYKAIYTPNSYGCIFVSSEYVGVGLIAHHEVYVVPSLVYLMIFSFNS